MDGFLEIANKVFCEHSALILFPYAPLANPRKEWRNADTDKMMELMRRLKPLDLRSIALGIYSFSEETSYPMSAGLLFRVVAPWCERSDMKMFLELGANVLGYPGENGVYSNMVMDSVILVDNLPAVEEIIKFLVKSRFAMSLLLERLLNPIALAESPEMVHLLVSYGLAPHKGYLQEVLHAFVCNGKFLCAEALLDYWVSSGKTGEKGGKHSKKQFIASVGFGFIMRTVIQHQNKTVAERERLLCKLISVQHASEIYASPKISRVISPKVVEYILRYFAHHPTVICNLINRILETGYYPMVSDLELCIDLGAPRDAFLSMYSIHTKGGRERFADSLPYHLSDILRACCNSDHTNSAIGILNILACDALGYGQLLYFLELGSGGRPDRRAFYVSLFKEKFGISLEEDHMPSLFDLISFSMSVARCAKQLRSASQEKEEELREEEWKAEAARIEVLLSKFDSAGKRLWTDFRYKPHRIPSLIEMVADCKLDFDPSELSKRNPRLKCIEFLNDDCNDGNDKIVADKKAWYIRISLIPLMPSGKERMWQYGNVGMTRERYDRWNAYVECVKAIHQTEAIISLYQVTTY